MSFFRHLLNSKRTNLGFEMKGICFVAFYLMCTGAFGQTCCTGGVPYLGVFRIPNLSQNQFGMNISYSHNRNDELIINRDLVSDNSYKRLVNTILFQTDYAFSDKISASIVLPYIIQSEQVQLSTNSQKIWNRGLGDISIWGSLVGAIRRSNYALSLALKTPNGETNGVDPETGIKYPLSFQTGTGSWDVILYMYNEVPLDKKKRFYWINQLSTKINSKGNQFKAHPGYRFGHVFQYFTSGSFRWVMGEFLANAFLGASFQKRLKDSFQGGFENENTGGDWIFLNLGYNHRFNPKFSFGLSGAVPVYRKVNGLQLTTSKQFNFTLGYII